MNIKASVNTKSEAINFYIKAIAAMVIVTLVAIGLGEYTSYLADVSGAAPEKSIKEFISGFGSLIFGLFTITVAGGALVVFGIMIMFFMDNDKGKFKDK